MSARERLQNVLNETGLQAKRSLGQNFLVSDHVIEKIIERARSFAPSSLIEIGPGPGALTHFLKDMAPLRLIELDRTMAAYWREKGLEVLEEDALKTDWNSLIADGTVLVSNLPYQISSSLVIERSLDDKPLKGMVLMFQKEVAQRIRAAAGTADYGLLTVISQTFWTVDTVAEAGPRDFTPAPRVASRVLAFAPKELPAGLNREKFLGFVKAAFSQRRKLMKSNLSGWLHGRQVPLPVLLERMGAMGFKETARAEELSPARFLELYEYLDRSGK